MNRIQALHEALKDKELIANFDRLYGANLSMIGSPIQLMINKSSGRLDSDFRKFVEFFDDFICRKTTKDKEATDDNS